MLKRRRDITDWPVRQIAKQTVACFTSDPDEYEVHAAAVLHLGPSLLPKDVESAAFNVFGFAFHDEDRTGLYMEGDPTVLVKMLEGAEALDEAGTASPRLVRGGLIQAPASQHPWDLSSCLHATNHRQPPTWRER